MRGIITNGGVRHVLSRSEKRLLKTIVESKGGESISDLCKKAGVHQKTWYRMIEHPRLGTLLPEALDYLLSQHLVPVMQVVAQRAKEGSAKHAELIFRISGLLRSEQPQILQIFGNRDEDGLMGETDIKQLMGGGR